MILRICEAVRLVALAILFGGSGAITFAAITLVKVAESHGVPVREAAQANAPVFIAFSKVALVASVILVVTELAHFALRHKSGSKQLVRYGVSFLCFLCTAIFSLVITPNMESLLPSIKTDEAAHAQFQRLHEQSRIVFGGTMLFALIALVYPAFAKQEESVE